MLIRSGLSRHSLHLQKLRTVTSPQLLPRCCSTHPRPVAVSRRLFTTQQELRPWKRRAFRSLVAYGHERQLATALGDYDYKSIEDLPFEGLPGSAHHAYSNPHAVPKFYDLRPFDPSSPLVIPEPAEQLARQRINPNGVPGDIEEMVPVFNACLQVGKLERAALILKRLGRMNILAPMELITMHNRYLEAAVNDILSNPSPEKAEELHKWYELNIRSEHLPQTAATVAYMLKASIISTHGSRLERLVTRYMGMAPGDAGLEVLYMTDILTDQDRATITDICPTYNLAIDDFGPATASEELISGEISSQPQIAEGDRAPEVLSTPQKGLGLKMLKRTLTLFSEIPEGMDISELSLQERREIQARLERDCVDAAIDRWRDENEALLKMGLNSSLSSASLNSKLYNWQVALEARLRVELDKIAASEAAMPKTKEDLDRCMYGPFLRQSSTSRLAAVTILSTLSSLAMHGADKGVPLGTVINQLSKVAEEDIRAQLRHKESSSSNGKAYRVAAMKALRRAKSHKPLDPEAAESVLASDNVVDPSLLDQPWPLTIRTKVGAALLSALMETARVTAVREHPDTKTLISQSQPAFSHANQFKKGKKVGMLLPNQTLVELMKKEPRAEFLARHLPMVVEPEPWSRFDKGGFLEYPSQLVRLKNGEKDQKIYTEAAIARGDMDQVLKGLDILGKTAWKINKPVFSVMLEAWNTGDAIANIPALNPDIPVPPEPESTDDPMKRRLWIRAVKMAENEKSGMHSVRCFMNFQIEIARAFRDQTLYFPHNIDFRGRAYPIPTYLNHMGADHVRGLMRFAKGKELGEAGLKWLKVHLANVFGYDKASLSQRESFAMEHLTEIFDSANNPLSGKRWWLGAEDPWQCLAACFELKAALESPEPTKYVSHLPIHQDGTCNGLQHYAALGGDSWGARQVNLEPGEKPADVYSAVANLVKESIAKDVEENNPFANAIDGKITRKVVKQTVMTNVYGVTFAGAKKQVLKQLDALYPTLHKDSGIDPVILSSYIATKIFKALSTMFSGAHGIQTWLGEIGGRVCRAITPDQLELITKDTPKSKGRRGSSKTKSTSTDELLSQFKSTVIWTTPLRMPVVQPYRKSNTRIVSTCIQDLVLSQAERSDPVNRRKQLQAFPPNFIHSLDASHMILSALECDELGLSFAAVHDSFWTHAADVNSMNQVIRDSFIRIHSEDVIGRLASEFEARYKGSIYLAKINHGTEVEKKVTAFRKMARMSLKDELLMEKKRLSLLNSSDPAEVEEGKKMVTPASIFEELSAAGDLMEPENTGVVGLGSIPSQEQASADALEETTVDEQAEVAPADEEAAEAQEEAAQDDFMSRMELGHFASTVTAPKAPKKKAKEGIQIWLPLTFPEIPEKGDFDVTRLKGSQYFFS
ncbi:DNA-directed RNA polymerase [Pleurostoma richardsiae]|uniref:DNA-directed RNA polymerase n=1 Tax=Pleurostoma richardsiae TaxID=41990 RepID=A0AA38RJZ7_9PEZI|nr:DNA-directed RNA polymerase [Pleurostoma richardsiae]